MSVETREVLTFSPTSIQTFLQCPRKFRLQSVERLVPRKPNKKLVLGKLLHAGFAAYYENLGLSLADRQDVMRSVYDLLTSESEREILSQFDGLPEEDVSTEEVVLEIRKGYELGRKILDAYAVWASQFDDAVGEVVCVEQPFVVPLREGVEWRGVMDLVFVDKAGTLWVMDHKTTWGTRFPSPDRLAIDVQFSSYATVARMFWPGYDTYGVVYDGVRMVDPTSQRTKNAQFWRYTIRHSLEEASAVWGRIERWVERARTDEDPSPGYHCDMCSYLPICVAMDRYGDAEDVKRRLYYKTEPNPMFSEED